MDFLQSVIQFTFETTARNINVKRILSMFSASVKAGNHE